jgi:hypothetical protein
VCLAADVYEKLANAIKAGKAASAAARRDVNDPDVDDEPEGTADSEIARFCQQEGGLFKYGGKVPADFQLPAAPAAGAGASAAAAAAPRAPATAGCLPAGCTPHCVLHPDLKGISSAIVDATVVSPFVTALLNQLEVVKGDLARVGLKHRARFDKTADGTFCIRLPTGTFNPSLQQWVVSCRCIFHCHAMQPTWSRSSKSSRQHRKDLLGRIAPFLNDPKTTNSKEVKLVVSSTRFGRHVRLALHIPYLRPVRVTAIVLLRWSCVRWMW